MFNRTANRASNLLLNQQKFNFARSSVGTLSRAQVPKERFMNRSEWMANKFKNQNQGSYDWVPDVMSTITPAAQYVNKGLVPSKGNQANKRMRQDEGTGVFKQGITRKNMMEERARTGRLYAHFKHIEMKDFIRNVRV